MRAAATWFSLLVIAACAHAPPPPPPPFHCYSYTWRTGHGSSCFPEPGVCDGHADEAHADPVYSVVTSCAPAARAYCYTLVTPPTPLCFATAEDCDAARAEEPGDATACAVTSSPSPPRTTPPR